MINIGVGDSTSHHAAAIGNVEALQAVGSDNGLLHRTH